MRVKGKVIVEIVDTSIGAVDGSRELTGPPVPIEMQQLFGWYRPGVRVTGVITLRIGISVGFEDGSDLIFVPQSYE